MNKKNFDKNQIQAPMLPATTDIHTFYVHKYIYFYLFLSLSFSLHILPVRKSMTFVRYYV